MGEVGAYALSHCRRLSLGRRCGILRLAFCFGGVGDEVDAWDIVNIERVVAEEL